MSGTTDARRKKFREPLSGTIVAGKYRVKKVLGQGGFSVVYLVETVQDGLEGHELAMKVLPAELARDAARRRRFLDEIRLAMPLVDRHIVPVRDVGVLQNGQLYYTLDHVPGRTLGQVLEEEGRLGVARTLRLVLGVLQGLRAAHARGVIHRDLKPGNLMVSGTVGREAVRILDFGIAGLSGRTDDAGPGHFAGTASHMAPEQFRGEPPRPQSDIFSVGVILYECLTGMKPFAGASPRDIHDAVLAGHVVAPRELRSELSEVPGLEDSILRALAADPDERFPSVDAFQAALRASWVQRSCSPRATAPRQSARTPAPERMRAARAIRGRPRRLSARRRRSTRSFVNSALFPTLVFLALGVVAAIVLKRQLSSSAEPNGQAATTAGREQSLLAFRRGVAHFRGHDFARASAAFRRSLELEPDGVSPELFLYLAEAEFLLDPEHGHERALAILRRAGAGGAVGQRASRIHRLVELDRSSVGGLALDRLLAIERQDPGADPVVEHLARKHLDTAPRGPDPAIDECERGRRLRRVGDHAAARVALAACFEDGTDPEVGYLLADSLLCEGRNAGAAAVARRALGALESGVSPTDGDGRLGIRLVILWNRAVLEEAGREPPMEPEPGSADLVAARRALELRLEEGESELDAVSRTWARVWLARHAALGGDLAGVTARGELLELEGLANATRGRVELEMARSADLAGRRVSDPSVAVSAARSAIDRAGRAAAEFPVEARRLVGLAHERLAGLLTDEVADHLRRALGELRVAARQAGRSERDPAERAALRADVGRVAAALAASLPEGLRPPYYRESALAFERSHELVPSFAVALQAARSFELAGLTGRCCEILGACLQVSPPGAPQEIAALRSIQERLDCLSAIASH